MEEEGTQGVCLLNVSLTLQIDLFRCRFCSIASSGYAWEGTLERSWDVIEEDDAGNLKIDQAVMNQHRQRYGPVLHSFLLTLLHVNVVYH